MGHGIQRFCLFYPVLWKWIFSIFFISKKKFLHFLRRLSLYGYAISCFWKLRSRLCTFKKFTSLAFWLSKVKLKLKQILIFFSETDKTYPIISPCSRLTYLLILDDYDCNNIMSDLLSHDKYDILCLKLETFEDLGMFLWNFGQFKMHNHFWNSWILFFYHI